jgi:hypothetical protein
MLFKNAVRTREFKKLQSEGNKGMAMNTCQRNKYPKGF